MILGVCCLLVVYHVSLEYDSKQCVEKTCMDQRVRKNNVSGL